MEPLLTVFVQELECAELERKEEEERLCEQRHLPWRMITIKASKWTSD
jgi:hypothetical protein